jgi:hypothetical protein
MVDCISNVNYQSWSRSLPALVLNYLKAVLNRSHSSGSNWSVDFDVGLVGLRIPYFICHEPVVMDQRKNDVNADPQSKWKVRTIHQRHRSRMSRYKTWSWKIDETTQRIWKHPFTPPSTSSRKPTRLLSLPLCTFRWYSITKLYHSVFKVFIFIACIHAHNGFLLFSTASKHDTNTYA